MKFGTKVMNYVLIMKIGYRKLKFVSDFYRASYAPARRHGRGALDPRPLVAGGASQMKILLYTVKFKTLKPRYGSHHVMSVSRLLGIIVLHFSSF